MQWYESNPNRWELEKSIGAKFLDEFEAAMDGDGRATFTGIFHVESQHGHRYLSAKLRFVYPPRFLNRGQPPFVYLDSHRDVWTNGRDSHIESDWKLCLFVPGESGIDFSRESSSQDLFAVIHTFLIKERIYQARLARERIGGEIARWPGEDRAHGNRGLREAISAMGGVGRNDPCPCGSGLKYKKCHLQKLER